MVSTRIRGKIENTDNDVEGVHIINRQSRYSTISDKEGFFEIPVREGDILVFSAVQYEVQSFTISREDIEKKSVSITLKARITQLNEVTLTPYNLTGDLTRDATGISIKDLITASSLDLPNANVKKKTQTERRLYEAAGQPYLYIGFGFSFNIHRLLNDISGRTKTLRKRLGIENAEKLNQHFRNNFNSAFIISELKIPSERIDEFVYFCAADTSFASLAKGKNKIKLLEFAMKKSEEYRKYNNLNSTEE
ncbi:hypothetical protein GWK08_03220 [Leptobacterium flavescens]|uniref:Carboxypeptidase-like regulatory domain-containing protein n=1 Tax=Leptobacterium flavescens TaxID=472055 RepID=A0A6P0UKM0_9FLAO|nr:carboxypeptidase-like regulatory domain-containing protein [Leptobacterium flavescens]NER12438.1 hypothetical protein [Leptobacterium flavescens]